MSENLVVGFIGNPTCGKTTLFNAFTGANLKVANWPGVTVEKVEGALKYHNNTYRLVDLPGTYSLTSYTMEEQVSRQYILSDEVDVIVDVADASSLERNLYLTLQLLELGKPVVLALNMMDIVEKRGMEIDLHRLPEMLGERARTGKPQVDVSFPEIEKFDHLPAPRAEGAAAFVSIMEGCSKYCTYCVVPYTRGEEISRPLVDVLVEVAQLADQGVKEVTLLGQNVNAYRGVTPEGDTADFAMLLEYVSEIDGIERIRYTTSHPREFTQRLIDAYTKLPKLVSHVHLPVQAGSDRILTAMKRGYSVLEYKSIIRRLKAARPGIAIATDFIVGFPGETAEDFEKTMQLIDDVGFDASFSFVYSPRPGTPAARLPDETPYSVKLERLQRLQRKIDDNAAEISRNMLGKIERVLVVGPARRGERMLSARTDNNRIVNFAGDPSLINQMTNVRITEVFPHTLGGELVD